MTRMTRKRPEIQISQKIRLSDDALAVLALRFYFERAEKWFRARLRESSITTLNVLSAAFTYKIRFTLLKEYKLVQ